MYHHYHRHHRLCHCRNHRRHDCHHFQVKRAQAEAESSDKKEKLKAGEKPFYLSKSKKKEVELVAKYEELETKGGLDTFMRKTTKKKDSKDRKKGLGVTVK